MPSAQKHRDSSGPDLNTDDSSDNSVAELPPVSQSDTSSRNEHAENAQELHNEPSAPPDYGSQITDVHVQDQGTRESHKGDRPELVPTRQCDIQWPTVKRIYNVEQAKFALRQMAEALDQHIAIYLARMPPDHPQISRPPFQPSARQQGSSPTMLDFQTIRTPPSRSVVSTPAGSELHGGALTLPLFTRTGKVLRPDQVFYAIRVKYYKSSNARSRTTTDIAPMARTAGEAIEMLRALTAPGGWFPNWKVMTWLCFLNGSYCAGPTIEGTWDWPHTTVKAFIMQTWVRDLSSTMAETSRAEMDGGSSAQGQESTSTYQSRRRKSVG